MKYFFGFRQIIPQPAGRWVAVGPFDTDEQAMAARAKSKAWDAEVSTPFAATSKEEAQEKCAKWG